jgi:signal transduction histidine kinase/ActR/RegA family two-component response regulator
MKDLSPTTQLYILGTFLLGGLGAIWSLRYLELAYPVALMMACVLATLLQILKIEGATERSSYSLSWVVYAAVFVSMGWPQMLVTILVAHFGEWIKHRYPWYIQSFNIAVYSITTIVAGLVYEGLLALPFNFYGTFYDVRQTVAIFMAMSLFTIVNHLMIGLVIRLARGESARESGVLTLTTITIDFGLLCLGVSGAFVAQTNLAAVVFIVMVAITLQSTLHVPALVREAERTAEIARAARAKYEFMATMNHELRTPLNAILLYAESLERKLTGPLNQRQERAVRSILDSARHLVLIINDVLDVAKIDAGKLDMEIRSTTIENVCQSSLLLISEMAQKKQLEIQYHCSPNVTQVDVDERRLKQMLVNLLSNAIKFTPEGGNIGLEVSGDNENNTVQFTVWDTGIGIDEENIKKLFQPFVQLDVTHAHHEGGTGLGLFLVRRMAELHGGSVAVTSKVNQGSRFTISVPWPKQRQALKVEIPESAESPRLSGPQADSTPEENLTAYSDNSIVTTMRTPSPFSDRIPSVLIADDNEGNLRVLSDFLQEWHCRILIARTGLEAVQQTKAERPDLVFMDIQMPKMDGCEAIRQIRIEPSLRRIPIIVLTASTTPEDREKCMAAGADDYINKPLQIERLTEVLSAHLGRSSATA